MATAMPANYVDDVMSMTLCRVDDVIHITFSEEMSKDTKYKEEKKQEIANAICALLNSNGGKVEFRGEKTKENLASTTILASWTRTIEQFTKSRFEAKVSLKLIKISKDENDPKMILISVNKASFLVTIKYHLCLPTQEQVVFINDVERASKIMSRRFVHQPGQLDSHHKAFFKLQNCYFGEKDVIQFKLLKSASTKRVTLADRMIGRSNKFGCYVSAFANHWGGHIYYGINDDGIVQGQEVIDISQIEKKVEKSIQKMIWPDAIGHPKRGEHWEIFFEPVLDENSNPIPSTFVIVIFIAPCLGGVFTEEPESYEMVEGNVERMSFTTWKEKLQPVGLKERKQEVPSTIKRISLSPEARKRCSKVNEALTKVINNVKWEHFGILASYFEQKYPDKREVILIVLLRKLMANYRQGNEASNVLSEYRRCFSGALELIERFFRFAEKVVARVSGKAAESRDISTDALAIAEIMEPGFLSAAALLIAALVYDSRNDEGPSPVELCDIALGHLKIVEDAPVSRADMRHAAHIILAAYHLGYNLSGRVIKKYIDEESFQKAQESIMAVYKSSVCGGKPLMPYRVIWFTLVQSMLYIRHSQFEPEKQNEHLEKALDYAKEAENLAKNSKLKELACWAQNLIQQVAVVPKIQLKNKGM